MYILTSVNNDVYKDIIVDRNLTVGRGKTNDIVIENTSVSDYHAKIYVEEDKIFIEDLESINGTFINKHKISPEMQYELKISQQIKFGELSYTVNLSEESLINEKEFIVGRDPKSDIYIDSDTVSFHHLKIIQENDEWYIVDNNSTNGTYLNHYHNRIDKIKLEKNQILYLASYKLNTNEIFNLFNDDKNIQQAINKDGTLIGRDPKSGIHIDNVNVSWNHAKIIYKNSNYYISDLNSTNGTFVNDILVGEGREINVGDKITLGVYNFIFQKNKQQKLSLIDITRNGFKIDAENVSYKVNINKSEEKILLDKLNFTIYPGEIVGIMGLSGAGKTTLLKILSGYSKPTEGQVFINGLDLYKNFDRVKNSIGYVPQEDIIHPELTVYESLFYSLKLRLKDRLTSAEIDKRIDNILKDLGIFETKNIRIGSPENKGISGGQRKRVNIAMELLAEPELIFLDEPTSGLSSVDAKVVMEKLKELSDSGKTILLTIHQPSLVNYKKMDDIIILTRGELAYFGPNYPDSIQFFNEETVSEDVLNDPDMTLLGLDNGEKNNINWRNKYEQSDIYHRFVEDRASAKSSVGVLGKKNSPSTQTQLVTLTQRYLKIKIKDKVNSAILLIQAPIIAILLAFLFSGKGLEFHNEHPSILFFILVISAMWFGIINSVKEIVSEKAIYERERLIGLKLIPYILSKFIVLAVLSLIQVLMLILIVNAFVPLQLHLIDLVAIVFVTSLSGLAIGFLTSTIAKSVSQALSLVPIVLLPMIIFGGGMIPIKNMPVNSLYLDAYRVSYFMPTRWSLEETIRIYDTGESNSSVPLREPKQDEKTLQPVYENHEVLQSVYGRNEPICEERRCVEELYIKKNRATNEWTFRTTSTNVIYYILLFFILFPLLSVSMILKRRDN